MDHNPNLIRDASRAMPAKPKRRPWLVVGGVVAAAVLVGASWALLQAAAPVIDNVGVSPAYIVINTPTTVLFTARIMEPTVLPGVNLLRTDAAGSTLATLGPLNDVGTNGDQVAGDRIFTRQVAFNEPTTKELYYRVSAPFKGVLRRTLSSVLTLTIDPVPLPPDPGEAGKQTLEGIDSDNDGVRDDVQRWIALNYLGRPTALDTLRVYAVSNQSMMTTESDLERLAAHKKRTRAIGCWQYLFPEDGFAGLDTADSLVLNTPERFGALRLAEGHFAGRIWAIEPDESGQAACIGLE